MECAIIFDTHEDSDSLDKFITYNLPLTKNKKVPDGFILVIACMNDCVNKLSDAFKMWLSDMGSKEIWNLGYRCGYTFMTMGSRD